SNIVVSAAEFAQLQLLVPGETPAPGTTTGKTGTPTAQVAGSTFLVTVNAADIYWNVANTVRDRVSLGASGGSASMPSTTALAAGTINLPVTFNKNGTFTLTANDVSNTSKAASISSPIPVGVPQFTQASGGSAISADTTGGSFSS